MSGDTRARRYALRAVRPSPARLDAPEPQVWLPILDLTEELESLELTAELETLDITGELELLGLEQGQDDLARELEAIESGFWRTAETEHPFLTGQLPTTTVARSTPVTRGTEAEGPELPGPVRADAPIAATVAPPVLLTPSVATPASEPVDEAARHSESMLPEAYTSIRPNRPAIVHRKRALRLRRRVIDSGLVIVVAAACVGVTARVLGGTRPRRDVTVSIDGRANTVVTRAGTVSDLLAAGGVVLHEGDRVVPSLSTQLRQGMPVQIHRAFPVVVDADGVVTKHRTTRHTLAAVRRELGLAAGMVRVGSRGRIVRGSRLTLRTPHDVTLIADGVTTPVARSTALTVGELLSSRKIGLGPQDELTPSAETRLTTGLAVQVFRLAPGQVAENRIIPFKTEYRDDPTLARSHVRTIRAGKNGTERVVSNVVRRDGTIIQWTEVSHEVVVPAVTAILARGTKVSGTMVAPPPPATGGRSIGSGYATWYASHAGAGACAHLTLPFGTIVKLVADSGRTAQCRVGDRGPEAWTGNSIDLNPDVFAQLAPLGTGRIHVQMYVVG